MFETDRKHESALNMVEMGSMWVTGEQYETIKHALEAWRLQEKRVGDVDELVNIIESDQIDRNTIYFIIEGAGEHGVNYRIYPGGNRPLALIHSKGLVTRDNRVGTQPKTQQITPPSLY